MLVKNPRGLVAAIHNDGLGLSHDETATLRWATRYVLLAPVQEPDGTAGVLEVPLTALQAMQMVRGGWLVRRATSLATPTAYIYTNTR